MRTMGKELRFHPVEFLEPGIRGFKILIRLLKFRRTFFDFRFQSYIQRFNLVISPEPYPVQWPFGARPWIVNSVQGLRVAWPGDSRPREPPTADLD